MTADTVTDFGSGVDNAVGKLETAYDARGRLSCAASLSPGGSTVLNEIAWDYNGFNQPVAEYQEHAGAVNKAASLKVGYTYDPGWTNTTRPTGIKYPHVGSGSAPVVEWNYSTTMADALSRISSIRQSGSILSDWRYVGLGMVVGQTYPAAANTALSYGTSSTTAANAYTGYDRFGRIVETRWKTGSTDQVHSKYGRNATGGIAWRQDVKAASILSPTTQDDHYWYDDLRQVTRHDRGQLTPGSPPYTGVTNLQQQEDFTYDETGNWKGYQSYAPALVQTREHNTANQITEIANPSGVVQPAYDPAGNMRTMPAPGDWTKAYTCKWDAWNRLVEIKDGGTLVQANTYDARTRRIRKDNGSETRDYYYDRQWRALEERVAGTVKADYVYSPTDRWNLIRRRRSVSGTLDETRFVLRDYLDPVAIVTTAGAVDERYGYDAFGPVRIMDASFGARTSSVCEWNWLFHGEFIDEDIGLYNYGYRFYDPQLGRWSSRDPIGESHDNNLYGFALNCPLNQIDIVGLACCQEPDGPTYNPDTHCCENEKIVAKLGNDLHGAKCCPAEYHRQVAGMKKFQDDWRAAHPRDGYIPPNSVLRDAEARFPCASTGLAGHAYNADLVATRVVNWSVGMLVGAISPAVVAAMEYLK